MSSEPKYRGKLPFDIVESDVDTGYNKQVVISTLQDIEIVNLHTDEYGHLEGSPLQGPFTETWVGGHQHRHTLLNTGSDSPLNRAEAFLIDLSPNTVRVVGPTHFDPLRPRAIYSRDNIAKSPLNLKNISDQNFRFNYEVVQTSGRSINDNLIKNDLTASGVLTTKFINFLKIEPVAASVLVFGELLFTAIIIDNNSGNGRRIRLLYGQSTNNITESGDDITINSTMTGISADRLFIGNLINLVNNSANWVSGIQKCTLFSTLDPSTRIPAFTFSTFQNGTDGTDKRNYELPQIINKTKSVFVERFSAPGDWKESSRGALDRNGEEYSPNNSLVTRNITVRQDLYPQLTQHAAQFTSGFHGVNRNGIGRFDGIYVLSSQNNQPIIGQNSVYLMMWYVTSSLYDNFWVQHSIPASDLRYKWIADANTNQDFASLLQYQSFAGTYNRNSAYTDITFNSSSFVKSGSNSQFEVNHSWIDSLVKNKKSINLDTNSFSITEPTLSASFSEIVNTPYGFSTWKQVRNTEHPVVRNLNKNNILSLEGLKLTIFNNRTFISKRADNVLNIVEPPVTIKFKPIQEILKVKNSEQNYSFIFSHQNNKSTFANKEISNKLGISENSPQMYDMLLSYYTDDNISTNFENPFSSLESLTYSETIYPRETNTFLAETRGRTAYILTESGTLRDGYDRQLGTQRVFWRDELENRMRSSHISFFNSMNYAIKPNSDYVGTGIENEQTGLGEKELATTSTDINYTSSLKLLDNYRQQSISTFDNNIDNSNKQIANYASHIYSGSEIDKYVITKTIDNGNSGELNSEIFVDYFYSSSATEITEHYKSQLLRVTPFTNYLQFDYQLAKKTVSLPIPITTVDYTGSYYSYSNYIFDVDRDIRWNPFSIKGEILYTIHNPRPSFTAFLGGFESGSRNYGLQSGFSANEDGFKTPENYNFFINQPTGPVSSTLDSGLRYAEEDFAGKKAWFDSYDDYLSDIRGLTKEYSIIPEFNISKNMPYYVEEAAGNFRAKDNVFLELDGANKNNYSSLENALISNKEFAKAYYLSDTGNITKQIQNDNTDTNLDSINFKVSGIKKLLPYNGFYPKERTIQLANLFNKFLDNNVDGGWFKFYQNLQSPVTNVFSINSAEIYFKELQQYFYKNTVMPYFFAPGILYNTIKSGISVDFPAITGSLDVLENSINLSNNLRKAASITSNFTIDDSTINLSYLADGLINTRIPFQALIFPETFIPLNTDIVSSVELSGSSVVPQIKDLFAKNLSNSLLNIKFDAYSNPDIVIHPDETVASFLGAGFKNSVPFAYLKTDKTINPSYSMAMSNFLAEIPKFFLKKYQDGQHLNVFRSANVAQWKDFDPNKEYYLDLRMKKSSNLVMIESYNSGSNRVTGSTSIEKTANGRYFGWPVNKLTASLNSGSLTEQFSVHNDPAYAPFTPPYFEGEAVLRFKLPVSSSNPRRYTSVNELTERLILDDIFIGLTASVSQNSEAYKHKMSLASCLDVFGVGANLEPLYDATTGQPQQLTDTQNANRQYWAISPYLETPVLDFSEQDFVEKTGSYWVSDGYGRGMWSGYGKIPTGNKAITLKLADSFPLANTDFTASLLTQVGFTPEQKKIGQLGDNKEISEAIILIPYIETAIQGLTTRLDGFNFFKLNLDSYLMQRQNLERGTIAVTAAQNSGREIRETSVSKLIKAMDKYVIPPNLNFLKYADITPFAMYIFEFKHMLDQQDLADIWQSVMPKISLNAENEVLEFAHKTGKHEFFDENFVIPQNMRWMVFKVKRKAEANYFAITENKNDDARFKFYFANSQVAKTPDYSYNWPYDYFSLVELAKVDISYTFKKKQTDDN